MDRDARVKSLYYVMQSIEGRLGGGEGVEGLYGSLSRTGMQRILHSMVQHCDMGKESRLVDIGSGLGRPLLHALVDPGITAGYGVEIDRIKCDKAAAFLRQARGEMARRGHLATDTPLPAIKCAPVEKVRTLDPATHAYSFWEGVPESARCAFARLFATSHSLRAVAVVQRAIRKSDPAAVMLQLGFGRVALVQSFSVAMSGSGRSFTAYIFRRLDPPGQVPASLAGPARPLMQISPPWRQSQLEARAVELPGTPEPREHDPSAGPELSSPLRTPSAEAEDVRAHPGEEAADRVADLDRYWHAAQSPSPPPRQALADACDPANSACDRPPAGLTRAQRAWVRGQRAIAAAAGVVAKRAASATPPAPGTPSGRDENSAPMGAGHPMGTPRASPLLVAKAATRQQVPPAGAKRGAASKLAGSARAACDNARGLRSPKPGLKSPKTGRVAKKLGSPVKAAATLAMYGVQRRGGAAKPRQLVVTTDDGDVPVKTLPAQAARRPVRRVLLIQPRALERCKFAALKGAEAGLPGGDSLSGRPRWPICQAA